MVPPRLVSCLAQDSLLRLKDHQQCFECSDVALHEAVQQMMNSSEAAAKEEWVATVTQLLQGIEQALAADSSGSILRDLSSTTGLVRLTNNLIQVTALWLCTTRLPSRRLPFHCKLGTPEKMPCSLAGAVWV